MLPVRLHRAAIASLVAAAAALAAPALSGQADTSTAPVIKGIEIRTGRIFDSAQTQAGFYRTMNALHITTRPYVVKQNLLFKAGDKWDSTKVDETERNLRALGIFQKVEIDSVRTDSGLIARVTTQDSWTLGIVFSIVTAGTQINYAIGFNAKNVAGTGGQFQFQYGKNADRDSLLFGLTKKYVLGSKYDVQVFYNDLSDGNSGHFSFATPFRAMDSPYGWTLYGNGYTGRIFQFFGGDTAAKDTLRKSYKYMTLNPAISLDASATHYIRLGLLMQLQSAAFQPISSPAADLQDTISGAFGPFLSFSFAKYQQVNYYQAGGRNEDILLGLVATVSLNYAPAQWGYGFNGVGPALNVTAGQRFGGLVVQESLSVTSLYGKAGLDSGSAYVGVTAWVQPTPLSLLIGYVGGGAQKNGYPNENWDLGVGYGVRAYPQHSFTGDRMFITSAEYRRYIWPKLLDLFAVGFAAFGDYSGAWYSTESMRTATEAGVGARMASITGSPGYPMRVDLAYRWANDVYPAGWVLALGKGFVWQVF